MVCAVTIGIFNESAPVSGQISEDGLFCSVLRESVIAAFVVLAGQCGALDGVGCCSGITGALKRHYKCKV